MLKSRIQFFWTVLTLNVKIQKFLRIFSLGFSEILFDDRHLMGSKMDYFCIFQSKFGCFLYKIDTFQFLSELVHLKFILIIFTCVCHSRLGKAFCPIRLQYFFCLLY